MTTKNLLVELFVEELPPKALKKLGEAFALGIHDGLAINSFIHEGVRDFRCFASPRRLAVIVSDVFEMQPDRVIERNGPSLAAGLDSDGNPTKALQGFARSCGVEVAQLQRGHDGKCFVFRKSKTGEALAAHLGRIIQAALEKLPIPKVMTYQLADGWSTVNFVRPAHGLIALHGADVVPVSVLGLNAGRTTQGHRFEATSATLGIRDADSYETQLESEGAVIPAFEKRRAEIARQLTEAAAKIGGGVKPVEDAALLDEVTALVERPNVLVGKFEESYLEVPQECLILTMKANQKYFPLLDAAGKLTHQFLIVSNIRPADPSAVIGGNERVVRPRLADAKFFFDQDRKKPLAARVEKLGNVVYHNKLGSQLARVLRVQKLAGEIARQLHANAEQAERAAYLAKADLLTDMVGEFPELQGIMGRYYAAHDGEPETVARAIEQHYQPRFAGDVLPEDNTGLSVALADKLDTLIGIYGIGLVPTGDKDPFGLRRHALGVLRILAEKGLPLDLMQLLQFTRSLFPGEMLSESVAVDVQGFMLERLKNFLRERNFEADEVDAVICQNPTRMDLVIVRVLAVRAFRKLPEAAALAAANKRIQNILKKTAAANGQVEVALLQEDAEKALFAAVNRLTPIVVSQVGNGDYTDALTTLAGVRAEVDGFFDEVMVMSEEPLIRANRLALLQQLGDLMNQVADISRLAQ